MTNDINEVSDEQFQNELSDFVKTLPKLTEAELETYNSRYDFMESIHTEIRLKHSDFMPVYDFSEVTETSHVNNYDKYMETSYSVRIERNTD